MRPRWEKVEAENPWLKTESYDYDQDREMVEKYGIEGGRLPVFIFLNENGKEIDRQSGELSEEKIIELILAYRGQ